MRIVSYLDTSGQHKFGLLQEDGRAHDLSSRFGGATLAQVLREQGIDALTGQARACVDGGETGQSDHIAQYLPVVGEPPRIFCVGLNYEAHRLEAMREKTPHPTIFLRIAASQVGHEQPILCPQESDCLDFEGEIAVVIGRPGRRIPPGQAWAHVAGVSAYNDVSVRDWQAHSTQWAPGKNFPGTGAFGPCLLLADALDKAAPMQLRTLLNGQAVQSADTSMMLFPIPALIAYLSAFTELLPGDVIVTGTPGGVGFKRTPPLYLKAGDEVCVEVSGVGRLVNRVVKEAGTA